MVIALVSADQWGWGSADTIGVFVATALLLGLFAILQVRSSHPLVPPRLFQSRTLVPADIGMLLVGAGVFTIFFLTLYMQQVLKSVRPTSPSADPESCELASPPLQEPRLRVSGMLVETK